MDIYSFITSRDIAAHCREIKHTWNPFDMALIIGMSNRPMAEKHAAWRELIAYYPDMPTPEGLHHESYPSLHKKLAEAIAYDEVYWKNAFLLFKEPEPTAVYTYEVKWAYRNMACQVSPGGVFSNYETAFTDIRNRYDKRDEVRIITITKQHLDNLYLDDTDDSYVLENQDLGEIKAEFDYDGTLLDIDVWASEDLRRQWFPDVNESSSYMFTHDYYVILPTPFKRGDVLTYADDLKKPLRGVPYKEKPVFLLDSINHHDPACLERRKQYYGDSTDMSASGYIVSKDGVLDYDSASRYDWLEYYREKLDDENTLLHYVSLFLKDDIGLPALLALQCRNVFKNRVRWRNAYLPDHLDVRYRLTVDEEQQIREMDGLMPYVADKLTIHHVDFLVKEFGGNRESIQAQLRAHDGYLNGKCASIVHDENYYEKTNDSSFNPDRRSMARMVLESYGWTENDWGDKHADIDAEKE